MILASWHSALAATDTHFLLPFRKVLHIFLFALKIWNSSIHDKYTWRGKGYGMGFQGKVEMNLICYLKLGCRALPGNKIRGCGDREKRNLDIIIHCLQYVKIPNSEVLHYKWKHQEKYLQPCNPHWARYDTTIAVTVASVGEFTIWWKHIQAKISKRWFTNLHSPFLYG